MRIDFGGRVADRLRVLILGPSAAMSVPALRDELGAEHEIVVEPAERGLAAEQAVREADVLVVVRLPTELARLATRARLVQVPGAGLDGVAVEALPPGVMLANAYEHESAIAEFVLLQMLALIRELPQLERAARAGDWSSSASGAGLPHRELAGRTVGILGYGRIGREVARLARAFRMRVLAVTRTPRDQDRGEVDALAGLDQLDWLLDESQFLVLALPLTAETRSLIGAEELRRLGPDGYIVNVARGPIVDERALYEALRDRTIAGAAIDTWYQYPKAAGKLTPVARAPFHELDPIIMTPHVAGYTGPTMERRYRIVAENVRRVARGEEPLNLVPR